MWIDKLRRKNESGIIRIRVMRDSVCMADDVYDHTKRYELSGRTTCQELFRKLKADYFFPPVGSDGNLVWVLTGGGCDCIASYFTRTEKLRVGVAEDRLDKICRASCDLNWKHYTDPLNWKDQILKWYGGGTYSMWRDGWLDEVQYCDYVMSLGAE